MEVYCVCGKKCYVLILDKIAYYKCEDHGILKKGPWPPKKEGEK